MAQTKKPENKQTNQAKNWPKDLASLNQKPDQYENQQKPSKHTKKAIPQFGMQDPWGLREPILEVCQVYYASK